MPRRLLILELLLEDLPRQRHGALLAHAAGWARAGGDEVRWLAYGVEAPRPPASPFLQALADPDADDLCAEIARFSPTHVLHSEQLAPALERRVRAAAPAARAVFAGDIALLDSTSATLAADLDGAERAPAEAQSAPRVVDAATPDWSCELRNDRARRNHPFVPLVVGPHCYYQRPLAANPVFAGLDLGGATRDVGCSFCDGARRPCSQDPAGDPVALGLRQVRAALATCPPERRSGVFRCDSSALFLHVGRFLEAVLAEGVAPARFLFTPRLDEFNARAEEIGALLPRLREAGHRLSIYNMAVENFSPAENLRFNKGLEAADAERALENLRRFQADCPGVVSFDPAGAPFPDEIGFAFILFTPWTTPDDLRLNLEHMRRLGFGPAHYAYTSRLQLMPRRPISLLAERDGLLAGSFDEGALDRSALVNRQREEDRELPWRFRDPTVAAIYRLVVAGGGAGADAALAARLRAAIAPCEGITPRLLLERLVEAAQTPCPPDGTEDLLGRLSRLAAEDRARPPGTPSRFQEEGAAGPAQVPAEEQAGPRPVTDPALLLDRAIDALAALLDGEAPGAAAPLGERLRAAARALLGPRPFPGELRALLREAAAGLAAPASAEALLELLERRAAAAPRRAPVPAPRGDAGPERERLAQGLVTALRDALGLLARHPERPLGRFEADPPRLDFPPDAAWELTAAVRGAAERVELRIRPAQAGVAPLHRTARLVVLPGRATPADTAWKRRVLAFAVEALERRLQPGPLPLTGGAR